MFGAPHTETGSSSQRRHSTKLRKRSAAKTSAATVGAAILLLARLGIGRSLLAGTFTRFGPWAHSALCCVRTPPHTPCFECVCLAAEVDKLRKELCKPREQLTLEPYHRDHAVVIGQFRPSKKKKVEDAPMDE
eukprot:GHVT01068173.1.p1 GENE.GHVT01068173.1~~GHVT01068173.1.p1  ORF type:complete len:133 (-),score=23.04 GHVT01068173.1:1335-1733(-)